MTLQISKEAFYAIDRATSYVYINSYEMLGLYIYILAIALSLKEYIL